MPWGCCRTLDLMRLMQGQDNHTKGQKYFAVQCFLRLGNPLLPWRPALKQKELQFIMRRCCWFYLHNALKFSQFSSLGSECQIRGSFRLRGNKPKKWAITGGCSFVRLSFSSNPEINRHRDARAASTKVNQLFSSPWISPALVDSLEMTGCADALYTTCNLELFRCGVDLPPSFISFLWLAEQIRF